MTSRRSGCWAAAVAVTLGGAAAGGGVTDLRSHELLRLDCRSDLARRETTLFANGTLRLREYPGAGMVLRELGPDELSAVVARLREENLDEVDPVTHSVDGGWIERCELSVGLLGEEPRRFTFGRLDTLSLALSRVARIADELGARAEDVEEMNRRASRLPIDYQPVAGDVLAKLDGKRFRVVGLTADKRGVELAGEDQPVTVFIALADLRGEFVTLVHRHRD